MGEKVFVVPGFPMDRRYSGNNYLLKDGATLVESADDVIQPLKNFAFREEEIQNKLFDQSENLSLERGATVLASCATGMNEKGKKSKKRF